MKNNIFQRQLYLVLIAVFLLAAIATAQGSGFNFQGRLNDGTNAATGAYDLQFRLYDSITGGTQIGPQLSRTNTVVINGVFSVTLDFGATAFNSPNSIFIEIAVRPSGNPNAFTILGPRQQLTVVPYAIRSGTAALADNATNAVHAQNAVNAQSSVNATNAENAVNAQTATTAANATNAANAVNAQNAVNATNSTNAVNANTATTANNSLNLGGFTASSFAKIDFQNPGNLLATGLLLNNDARQPFNGNGLVKAMVVIKNDGTPGSPIVRCYNGINYSSTEPCNFTVTRPLFGVTRIDFGFQVSFRFVSIACEYTNTAFDPIKPNSGANYRFFNSTTIEVFTFLADNAQDTFPTNFTLIIF